MTEIGQESIRMASNQQNDERLIDTIAGVGLIAVEAHYHPHLPSMS